MTKPAPLLLIVARRVIAFSLLAMLIQFAIVVHTYWSNSADLGRSVLETEVSSLVSNFHSAEGETVFEPSSRSLAMFARDAAAEGVPTEFGVPQGYYAQVRDTKGIVLFSNCGTYCQKSFLPYARDMPADWQRTIRPGWPLTFAGGRVVNVFGHDMLIEFASIGDPQDLSHTAFIHEVYDHLVVPMSLMLFLVVGATIISIRKALEPIEKAAEFAAQHNPQRSLTDLPTSGMPLEVVRLTEATNRVLGRARQLIQAQKVFASALSHEIRTPVSIAQLELEYIDHPRARKAIRELESLTISLETLTALARLELIETITAEDCDLAQIAGKVVTSIAPLVYSGRKSIGFEDMGNAKVRSAVTLAEMMIRSLVENAIKHSVPGTAIEVVAGPGPQVIVSSYPPHASADAGLKVPNSPNLNTPGLGLRILDKISDILGGKLIQGNNAAGGFSTSYTFANMT